jgi:hypothetical protein
VNNASKRFASSSKLQLQKCSELYISLEFTPSIAQHQQLTGTRSFEQTKYTLSHAAICALTHVDVSIFCF